MEGQFQGHLQPNPLQSKDQTTGSIILCCDAFPSTSKSQAMNDTLAVGTHDGRLCLLGKNGRLDKSVEVHQGGVLTLQWNQDGSAIATGGEDGFIKIFSRSAMLRSTLVQCDRAILKLSWSPESDRLVYTYGSMLVAKPLQPSVKATQWKAHDGIVLAVDWHRYHAFMVSVGEDRKYKIWDAYGRQYFSSSAMDASLNCVRWSPQGDVFAVGGYNQLRLCDKAGWTLDVSRPTTESSVFDIVWSAQGTQCGLACGDGSVHMAMLDDRRLEWKEYEIAVQDGNQIHIRNSLHGSTDHIELKDPVLKMALAHSHLLIVTVASCYIYHVRNWNTPVIMELGAQSRVTTLVQTNDAFALLDTEHGLRIFSYDGRLVSSPKHPNLHLDHLNDRWISLSNDTVVIRDPSDEKAVFVFETMSGRPIGEQPLFKHTLELQHVIVDQTGGSQHRMMAFVDKNRDLYVCAMSQLSVQSSSQSVRKLSAMVDDICWNEDNSMLAAISDGQCLIWYFPGCVFIDPVLVDATRYSPSSTVSDDALRLKQGRIIGFNGTRCTIRRQDGAMMGVAGISPFPVILMELVRRKQWTEAVKLCRYIKLKAVWSCLAALSIQMNELNTAEVAYAALDDVAKVQFICHVRDIPSMEGQKAELAMFRQSPREAENILLTAGLVYRCVQMWLDLYQWERALDIALKYKTHVDTVLYHRQRYLNEVQMDESKDKFKSLLSTVPLNPDEIQQRITMEMEQERHRSSVRR